MNFEKNVKEKNQRDREIKGQKKKISEVIQTDAIIDPDTMMVHINDISFTSITMITPVRFQGLEHTFEALILEFSEVRLATIE